MPPVPMPPVPFPNSLETVRLTLRQPDDDVVRLEHELILASLDHLWPWFGFRDAPPTLADRLALAARHRADAEAGRGATYAVFAGDTLVGKIWFDRDPDVTTTATMGWYLGAGATGRGYATEAVRRLVDLMFELGIERLEAHTDPDNLPSRALAERVGFVLEEIRPDFRDRPDGVRRPECIYVLVAPRSG